MAREHPLRSNKAFEMAYSSYQEHQRNKKCLNGDNIHELVSSLNRLKHEQTQSDSSQPSWSAPHPPPPHHTTGTFTESFIQSNGLPLPTHQLHHHILRTNSSPGQQLSPTKDPKLLHTQRHKLSPLKPLPQKKEVLFQRRSLPQLLDSAECKRYASISSVTDHSSQCSTTGCYRVSTTQQRQCPPVHSSSATTSTTRRALYSQGSKTSVQQTKSGGSVEALRSAVRRSRATSIISDPNSNADLNKHSMQTIRTVSTQPSSTRIETAVSYSTPSSNSASACVKREVFLQLPNQEYFDIDENEEEFSIEEECMLDNDDSEDEGVYGVEEELLSDLDNDTVESKSSDEISIITETSGVGLEDCLQLNIEPTTEMKREEYTGYRISLEPIETTSQGAALSASLATTCEEGSGGVRGADQVPSLPLTPSLFANRPPTIHFPVHNEKYKPLPKSQRALLKWKNSPITPNVVKDCIIRVGFTLCSKGSNWIGYWGHHMKAEAFKLVKDHQKINHFPGTFQMGRKDRLWRNMSRMMSRYGKKEYGFAPQTFVLPQDMSILKRTWEEGGTRQKWILKPPASARGIGIRVIHKWIQIPKKRPVIVQKYLADPFLVNGSKFDLRIYVYITSYDPLRVYIFRDGLVRFATCKYSKATKALQNRFMHLTNYSVNKRNTDFIPNSDETVCQGHKWGLVAFWRYMRTTLGIDPDPVWNSIKDVVIKTAISCESQISSLVNAYVKNKRCVHELFGFDIMLDRNLKPWLLEVNVSPSLHSNSNLDINIKGQMMRDLLNMAMFHVPIPSNEATPIRRGNSLSLEERVKHSFYIQKHMSKEDRHRIVESLTRDDCRVLMETEDEHARCGQFIRVFPDTQVYGKYGCFFEREKYYNILLEEFAYKYSSRHQGVVFLQDQWVKLQKLA